MDKNQLEQFLEEHGGLRARGHWAKYNKKEINHNEDSLKWSPLPVKKPCSDCDRMVVDRRIDIKVLESGKIRKKCSICRIDIGKLK